MTIDVKTELFGSARDEGVAYVESADVGFVSIVGERHEWETSLTEVTAACVERAQSFVAKWSSSLQDHRLVVFAATPAQYTPNVIARRGGIWGCEDIKWLSADARHSPSIEFHDASGTRFIGLAEVSVEQLAAAADYVRTVHSAMLFFTSRIQLTEEHALALCERAFPSGQSSVNWASVVNLLPGTNDILLKVYGDFDDREIAVYILVDSELLARLGTSR